MRPGRFPAFPVLGALILTSLALPAAPAGQQACVPAEESRMTVFVDKAGLFSLFAHDHMIDVGQIDACAVIDPAGSTSSVSVSILAASLKVADPEVDEEERGEIQEAMERDVLDVSTYPEIVFVSTAIEPSGPDHYRVTGDLTIHGVTKTAAIPVTLEKTGDAGGYRVEGEYTLRQTDFGIEPIRLLGGTVRVRDEVRIEFRLSLRGR